MAKTLEQNINQAISDFASIKEKIVEKGVGVPAGTPTRDYAAKVDGVYEAGAQEICDVVNPKIVEETERLNNHVSGAAYDRAFEAGRKAEYDAFWDSIYGADGKISGVATFAGKAWNHNTLNPPRKITLLDNCYCAFYNCGFDGSIAGIIDFADVTAATSMFTYSKVSEIGALDLTGVETLGGTFSNSNIKSIQKLVVSQNVKYIDTFYKCLNLTSVVFEGYIGNNIDLSYSPLNKASLTSIINALSTTTTSLTVALRLSAVNTAFETSPGAADGSTSDEWLALAATKPNWTISLINS